MIAELSLDGRDIASVILLRSGDCAWPWKIAYDEDMARFSPGLQAMTDLTAALLADESIRFADSCAVPDHPLIDHLWRDRLSVADVMVALGPGASFALACRMETMRRDALATARRMRNVLRRAMAVRS
jgi:hypothetical protein